MSAFLASEVVAAGEAPAGASAVVADATEVPFEPGPAIAGAPVPGTAVDVIADEVAASADPVEAESSAGLGTAVATAPPAGGVEAASLTAAPALARDASGPVPDPLSEAVAASVRVPPAAAPDPVDLGSATSAEFAESP
ncbi:MAG: hypothetical protein R3E48_01865 [Burkholderiaceae bacterium]